MWIPFKPFIPFPSNRSKGCAPTIWLTVLRKILRKCPFSSANPPFVFPIVFKCRWLWSGQARGWLHSGDFFTRGCGTKSRARRSGRCTSSSVVGIRNTTTSTGRNSRWFLFYLLSFQTFNVSHFQEFVSIGLLTQLYLAFSRTQEEKVYVQHKLWEHRETMWELIQKGASIYVCGWDFSWML